MKLLMKVATALLFPVLLALGLVSVASPAQAYLDPYLQVAAYVDYSSQSNMLFSFQSDINQSYYQAYVGIGECNGEGFNPPFTHGCTGGANEPQNMWTNPHWCSGYRVVLWHKSTGTATYYGWHYISGGAYGVSTPVNPETNLGSPSPDNYEIEAYLVPNGAFGCVS